MAVVRHMAITFEKRDWGSGRKTWRETNQRRKLKGNCEYSLRRISNKKAKRRELSGDVLIIY